MVTNGSSAKGAVLNSAGTLELNLHISDMETCMALSEYEDDQERHDFAVSALRIGVIALRQVQGQIDADKVRQEGERIIVELGHELSTHQKEVTDQINGALKEYFDPASGRFNERIKRLIESDGDLERVMRKQVGSNGSELNRTLAEHVGMESPLMKQLDPQASDGLISVLTKATEDALDGQRQRILAEFSLDNGDGALSRLVTELKLKQGEVGTALEERIEAVVGEFSLDKEDSALSRLMNRVERAQQQISSEFSLDEDDSALARMRKDLLAVFEEQRQTNEGFQREVIEKLAEMTARKQESERSTRHGLDFEDAVFEFIEDRCRTSGDIPEHTGNTSGRLGRSKVGDAVIELGSESAAAGARIVIEAKQNASYTLKSALSELEEARKNRDADVGLFVFSSRTAPEGIESFSRYGNNVVVVWNSEDPASDMVFNAGLSVAKAMSVRARAYSDEVGADIKAIEDTVLAIQQHIETLDQITTWSTTIRNNSNNILKKVSSMRDSLSAQVSVLDEKVTGLSGLLDS